MPFPLLALAPIALALVLPARAGDLAITDAWIRALPPTQPTTAAYLTVHNRGRQAVTITGASAEGAGRVEIHTTREVDGLMRMTPLSTLEVPAGGSAVLEPGGTHLMLLDLDGMPAAGESRELCLSSDQGQRACTSAEVRKGAADSAHQHHHH